MLDFILKKEEASLILPTSMPVGFRVSGGESENMIGKWMKQKKNRSALFITSKSRLFLWRHTAIIKKGDYCFRM